MSTDEKDSSLIFDLNFAPSWARSSPDANLQRLKKNDRFDSADDDGESHRHGRDKRGGGNDRRPRRDFDDRPSRGNDRRPPRDGDRRGPRPDMPRPESRGAVVDFNAPSRPSPDTRRNFDDRRRPNDGNRPNDGRRPNDGFRPNDGNRPNDGYGYRSNDGYRTHSRDRDAYPQQPPPLPIEIRVLPEQKALGAVIRRIQTSHRAFPLRDIAWLFLDNPNSCLIRIEPLKDQTQPLFQCKVCGYPALTEEEVKAHLISRHLEDFFDIEEVDCEPPTGVFNCVARCTLSGELLGPPNHHSFALKVQEMLRTRYSNMTEEAYRSRIEMVRDPEVVEQWRQKCTRKKVYRRKGAAIPEEPAQAPAPEGGEPAPDTEAAAEPPPKAPALTREVAELVFLREVVPEQLTSVKYLICTAGVATQTSSRPLAMMLRDALMRERRFPTSLFYALRGAFRHRKLYLFRVNDPRGVDFVMLKTPTLLDASHTVQTLKDILTYVETNPACTKLELVAALADTDEAKKKEVLIQLAWLVERGHVIEFYNDVLSVPNEYPAFKFLPGEKNYQTTGGGTQQRPAAPATEGERPREPMPTEAPEAKAEEPVTQEAEAPAPQAEEEPAAPAQAETEAQPEAPAAEAEAPAAEADAPVTETEAPAPQAEEPAAQPADPDSPTATE